MPATPPSQQSNPAAVSFSEILARLRTILPQNSGYVRGIVAPNPSLGEFSAEEGVQAYMLSPQPAIGSQGNGRWGGLKATRDIIVYVNTRNNLDAAGRDEIAIAAHCTLEEVVIDAVADGHRSAPYRAGIQITWVPGGEPIVRAARKDQGLLTSVLTFRLSYGVHVSTGPGPAS